MDSFPPCYGDLDAFERDRQLSELSGIAPEQYNFCRNCSPAWQAEQLAVGKCSRPETRFILALDDDGEIERIGLSEDVG